MGCGLGRHRPARNPDSEDAISSILSAVDEIEDNLYFFSDVISAGVPDFVRLITDNILQLLIFPSLLPSLGKQKTVNGTEISLTTSLYLLCCVLRIVKTKELASSIAAALFFAPSVFIPDVDTTANGNALEHQVSQTPEQEPFSCHSYTDSKQLQGACSLCRLDVQNNINDSLVSLR
ncbi:hypothetical protein KSP40_PGU008337 [Platanthera guangdongensis]|uniref:Uncharacterized protein n=1 Tax=Platanthera guangdongensis TaxID=2320717 RepID=A0ABR2MXA7_9ASPA